MRSNFIYGFDRQRMFKARYMAGNNKLSQEHKRYNKKNMGQESLLLTKSKWVKNHHVVLFRLERLDM